jgi:hypothetical protein
VRQVVGARGPFQQRSIASVASGGSGSDTQRCRVNTIDIGAISDQQVPIAHQSKGEASTGELPSKNSRVGIRASQVATGEHTVHDEIGDRSATHASPEVRNQNLWTTDGRVYIVKLTAQTRIIGESDDLWIWVIPAQIAAGWSTRLASSTAARIDWTRRAFTLRKVSHYCTSLSTREGIKHQSQQALW